MFVLENFVTFITLKHVNTFIIFKFINDLVIYYFVEMALCNNVYLFIYLKLRPS